MHERHDEEVDRGVTLTDIIAFFVNRWRPLVVAFGITMVILIALALYSRSRGSATVGGTVLLTFSGIETHTYPTGRHFDPLDIISPQVVSHARQMSGIGSQASIEQLGRGVSIAPVIPEDVLRKWRAADREGHTREQFYPNEYRLYVSLSQLKTAERLSFVNHILTAYRDRLADELYSRSLHVADPFQDEGSWRAIDPWDLPQILERSLPVLRTAVYGMVRGLSSERQWDDFNSAEGLNFDPSETGLVRDPNFALRFVDLNSEISLFERGELAALSGYTYNAGLVRDRDIAIRRTEVRLQQATDQLSRQQMETKMTADLLAKVDRPQFLVPGAGASTTATEMKPDVIQTLLRNDYYAELVRRSVDNNSQTSRLDAQRAIVQRQLDRLRGAVPLQEPPEAYNKYAQAAVGRFRHLLQRYRALVTEYVDSVAGSQVVLKEGPYVDRGERIPLWAVLAAILSISLLVAIVGVLLHDIATQVRRRTA